MQQRWCLAIFGPARLFLGDPIYLVCTAPVSTAECAVLNLFSGVFHIIGNIKDRLKVS